MIVTTGFFDGVHAGHTLVLGALVNAARERGEESLVVTFWPHPRNVLQDGARGLRLLSSLGEKRERMLSLGVDRVEVLPFTKEFSALSARDYIREVLVGRFGATAMVVGYDNRLGSDRLDSGMVAGLARKEGMDVILSPVAGGDSPVSSTRIRNALQDGDIALANAMLGYGYQLHGVVVEGNRLGRTLGFPTANMQLYEPLKLVPANGVYAVDVQTLGKSFRGMCNIGVRPTVASGNARTIETHILDFDEDIYGLDISLSFVRRIRDERRFPSLEALSAQLAADREAVRL
ncbi:MAG: riboflavin biosynthesis protein RibF [Bacteroidales bacterium]|nr:riboflavin biosynthesis protein RibF [Bacteroidales bacterium]